jgi:hypothetical protein
MFLDDEAEEAAATDLDDDDEADDDFGDVEEVDEGQEEKEQQGAFTLRKEGMLDDATALLRRQTLPPTFALHSFDYLGNLCAVRRRLASCAHKAVAAHRPPSG